MNELIIENEQQRKEDGRLLKKRTHRDLLEEDIEKRIALHHAK